MLLLGFLDFLSGSELSTSLFYVLPIALITWFVGTWPGIVVSLLSSTGWLIADLASNGTYSHDFILYGNMIIRSTVFLIITFLLARLHEVLMKETQAASYDFITGAMNWKSFSEIAERELTRSRRNGRPISVSYIDLDGFKQMNDTFGHNTGDALLRTVAETIRRNIRSIDSLARMGGDEFAILMPETDGPGAERVVKRVHGMLLESMRNAGWPVTFSIGVCTYRHAPGSVSELVRMVDDLMYTAKKEGKNSVRYSVYEAGDPDQQRA